ncbi:helix-turn-helix transcriptional regulator [uncultured Phascolarctobacterium sp.]|uniref:helix-turn-helix domain-containing protein n=1 Tax=uncultured Phascolarctobacterium sp. TaxID=512296 RepID=UPI002614F4A2|nr:helix-turn-helix transcriptional regulator [uncultured Phascolarctobacterium sp.]
MHEEIKLIGRRIRLLRTAKNLTQTELAKEMEISQTHLCNIECGRVPVTLPNLLKLHSLLECDMASFFVDLDKKAEAQEDDISLDDVLQLVKLLKQKK